MLGKPDLLSAGHRLNHSHLLFEKVEDADVEKQVQKLLDTKKANESAIFIPNPARENITFDQFSSMDIRVGTVLEAVKVPKTQKLLKLIIDTGIDKRTVVSGIAEYYSPEEITGRQVCVLVNLESKPLKGIESKGMILCAQDTGGKLVLVSPERLVENGSEVK